MYCSHCGVKNVDESRFCTGCGTSLHAEHQISSTVENSTGLRQPISSDKKNPILAMVLSIGLVGLGQFYNKEFKKGALMLGVAVLGVAFSAEVLWIVAAIWSVYDAYTTAKAI